MTHDDLVAFLVGLVLAAYAFIARRLFARIDAIETRDTVSHAELKDRERDLDRTLTRIRSEIQGGFSTVRADQVALAAELTRQSERHDERTSRLVAEVHARVEMGNREFLALIERREGALRNEIERRAKSNRD